MSSSPPPKRRIDRDISDSEESRTNKKHHIDSFSDRECDVAPPGEEMSRANEVHDLPSYPSSGRTEDFSPSRSIMMRALVTTKDAGIIIGKGGVSIGDVRESSGARVQISENIPGCSERILTITGPIDSVAKAFSLCASKLAEEQTAANIEVKHRQVCIRMLVHHNRMGAIIGAKGSKIKEIQDLSGGKIIASEDALPGSTERFVFVTGVVDSIHIASYHIGNVLLENLDRGGAGHTAFYIPLPGIITSQVPSRSAVSYPGNSAPIYSATTSHPANSQAYGSYLAASLSAPGFGGSPVVGSLVTQQIMIPNDIVGSLIGKGGVKINEVRNRSGCTIKIGDPIPGDERIITITGTTEASNTALYMLYQRIELEKQKAR